MFACLHRHPSTWRVPMVRSRDDDGVDGGGVLPPELHRRLCALFKPGAPYWKESDYENRGYYSYFLGLNDDVVDDAPTSVGSKKRIPTNVIEDVIFKHLLPLAERSLRENKVGIPSSSPPSAHHERARESEYSAAVFDAR